VSLLSTVISPHQAGDSFFPAVIGTHQAGDSLLRAVQSFLKAGGSCRFTAKGFIPNIHQKLNSIEKRVNAE
jgi:hypothetical protein